MLLVSHMIEPMIEFSHVTFAYDGTEAPAVSDVSFCVAPGERVVVLGDNGSGKSTLARLANGSLEPDSGTVRVDGVPPAPSRVAVVRQDPTAQIVSSVVLDEVCFGPANLGLPRADVLSRAREALRSCGIGQLGGRACAELPFGEQRLVALAGALAMHVPYLVVDEVTSQLGPREREHVARTVDVLVTMGVGVLEVTHDLDRVAGAARVVALEEGRQVDAPAPAPPLPARPVIPAESHELAAESLTVRLGGVTVLEGVRLAAAGGLTLVCGESGSGKSVLLRALAGVLEPAWGVVTLDGHAVRAGQVGLSLQRPPDQLFCSTVAEDIAYAPTMRGLPKERAAEVVEGVSAELGLASGLLERSPFELSGGQERRAALAGVFAQGARALALDEPLAGLDARGRALVLAALARRIERGVTVLVATNEPDAYAPLVTGRLELADGRCHRA